jgi:hypothetical protein
LLPAGRGGVDVIAAPRIQRAARRRLLPAAGVLAAVIVVLLSGCAGHQAASPAHRDPAQLVAPDARTVASPVHTAQQLFAPFDASGAPRVAAVADGAAHCFATSIAVPLAGVYRCLSGNELLDPCFAPAGAAQPAAVACFTDPWTPGRRMALQGALPTFVPLQSAGNPWALELVNGARCVFRTGTVPQLDGVDLLYGCDSGDLAGISDDGTDLTAHYGPVSGPLEPVPVTVSWRGQSYRYGD